MDVRLTLVVPADSRELFRSTVRGLKGVRPQWIVYESEQDIRDRAADAIPRSDALFFAGPMPYDRCRDLVPDDLPVCVARLQPLDLALALSRAQDRGLPIAPLSCDTFEQPIVDEVAEELTIPSADIVALPHSSSATIDELVAFHVRAWHEHATAFAITGRTAVHLRLASELPVPVFKVVPVRSSVRAVVNEAALKGLSSRAISLRFGAALFKILGEGPMVDSHRHRLDLTQLLMNAPQLKDAWIEERGTQSVLLFAHKGLLENITGGWSTVPIVDDAKKLLGLDVAAGFGLGESARKSVLHAEQALARAESEGRQRAYLIGEQGLIIGPMGGAGMPLRFAYQSGERDVTAIAERVGISVSTFTRLADLEQRVGDEALSAAHLADALDITPPSGRRLIRALREQGLVEPVGVSQPAKRGRPSQLYRLQLRDALEQARSSEGADR